MIREGHGNLLPADAEVLVNTVNTVGVMGKGLALQFRRAYPEMFEVYAEACKRGEVVLGRVHVWPTGATTGPRFVVSFPTKGHWRARSDLADLGDVRTGLVDLERVVRDLEIRSIAVPALGCGFGRLAWTEVGPLILSAFSHLTDIEVTIHAPEDAQWH